jgi:hypothetical protein
MADIRILNMHRNWEDWLGMALGAIIGLSPWLAGEQDNPAILWNVVIVGALVIALAAMELASLQRWEEGLEIAAGLWLAASPFIFGYADAGTLRYWHFILGAGVMVLAVLELWQDWKLSDKQLAQHGR